MSRKRLVSIVVPVFNESEGIKDFYKDLIKYLPQNYEYEILFVDDGSKDDGLAKLNSVAKADKRVKILVLSRNFGKEVATSAGINISSGEAVLTLDADGQHPVELISEFFERWSHGARIVVGVRNAYKTEGLIKRYGSRLFYAFYNIITTKKLVPGSTDFRLIDRSVKLAFSELHEKNRMTRSLIDWLGYEQDFIYFTAKERTHGNATYSTRKLIGLAMSSVVSSSLLPLYVSGYIGLIITPISFFTGIFVLIEQYALNDPLGVNFTGTASLGILTIFLVGLMLLAQGLSALYISRIYEESKSRPLYVVDRKRSVL